ncbi:MAG: diaminopimelate decarboxylase [Chloroflexi bacterium]|nr:diaminopimelate decarboxylase [Chloroflexota bacterium]
MEKTDASSIVDELGDILPITARVNSAGHLEIGGCDLVSLAQEFGTPLYAYDEATLRHNCARHLKAFSSRYPDVRVLYAGKAYLGLALLSLLVKEGLGLDVVSGGELALAQRAGFPMELVYFHGNNKSAQELELALKLGVGRIVVDNLHELERLNQTALGLGAKASVLLRLSPNVDPHTHRFITTGLVDSKFGFPLQTGAAEEAVGQVLASPGLQLLGFHAHIGSQICELEPYRATMEALLAFAGRVRERFGFVPAEISPGGGWGIRYTREEQPPEIEAVAGAIADSLVEGVERLGLPRPRLVVEPGRAIVARAGVALYTVGSIKEVPGVRTYVAVDGGMADNIRPALYDARYEVVAANRVQTAPTQTVTVAGKYCESGDILARDVHLPRLEPGDLLAIPAAGAYCLPLASNYNLSLRPAVVMVKGGQARLVRRRECYEDLWRLEAD